jgi:hypothetical protein
MRWEMPGTACRRTTSMPGVVGQIGDYEHHPLVTEPVQRLAYEFIVLNRKVSALVAS